MAGWGERRKPTPIELTPAERSIIEMLRRLTRLRDRAAHIRRKMAKDDALQEELLEAEAKAGRERTAVHAAIESTTAPRSIP
jgi:hypothetical protein